MEAIRVLKECEFDNRFATPEEQEILSQYVGWGGIPEAFDENNSSWADEFIELYTALSPDEYESARASTLTAFYTPPVVISAIYKAMEHFVRQFADALADLKPGQVSEVVETQYGYHLIQLIDQKEMCIRDRYRHASWNSTP